MRFIFLLKHTITNIKEYIIHIITMQQFYKKRGVVIMELDFKVTVWQERLRQRMTLSELSKLSGISKSTLHRIETNKIMPKMKQLIIISIVLKVDIKTLYEVRIRK